MTTKTKVRVGKQSRDRRGRSGVGVSLEIEAGGWNGVYQIGTHGKTDDEIVSERDRIVVHHEKKAVRMTEFMETSFRRPVFAAGEEFEVRDCMIVERGTDVALFVRLRHSSGERVEFEEIYSHVDAIPPRAEVLKKIREAATAWVARNGSEQNRSASVAMLLGGE